MLYRLYFFALVAFISGVFFFPAQGEDMNAAPDSLLTSTDAHGWSVGVSAGFHEREVVVGEELTNLDASYLVAELDYAVLPYLAVILQGGYGKADGLLERDGERGVAWAVGVDFNVLEYVIEHSPVFGDISKIGFQVKGMFRSMQSNFEDSDFDWTETTIAPLVYYTVSSMNQVALHKYNPDGASIKCGVVLNSIDGEYGDSDVEENRDFGMMLGMDLRFAGNWLTMLEGAFYGSGDREISVGMLYRF